MAQTRVSGTLRWLFFCVGVGALVASGVYVGTATRDPDTTVRLLRAMMFLLLGLFMMLMYGEHTSRASGRGRASDGDL
ncbi:MAG: hypothetical protein ABIG03_01130 [Candidatus Eisenbacteria bacterium]